MTPQAFQELRHSFEQLLELDPGARAKALNDISQRDPSSGAELRRMLQMHDSGTDLLDRSPVNALTPADWSGRQLGPYSLQKQIGTGGMGVVYEAIRVDESFRKRVAIKILRHDLNSKLLLSRFQRERQILAGLEHPHIAAILDGGATPDGDPYFVMEHVDGIPITKYAEDHGLSISQRLALFLQACDAVQYAHRKLTVHRDLKPGNIFVTASGNVKLLDFGVAKLLEPDDQLAGDAPATEAFMTPAYASPEQIRREPASTLGDVFQLGIVLYELITGQHPFRGEGKLPHEVMHAICDEDPPPPSTVAGANRRYITGELDSIVLTALRKQPSWRYPSVEQLAGDVERYMRGWPVLARGNSVAYRFEKFVRRQWLPLTATAALIAMLVAGIVVTTREAQIADAARRAAEASRRQAENARLVAEQQRQSAERAKLFATEQQQIADSRRKDAELERSRAQQRYRDERALASSLLFDLYDGVKDLAGSTTARRLIVSKAQHQLELLSAESGKDVEVQRDLAASYERMGELRVDPRKPNQNDSGTALGDLEHAVTLRKELRSRTAQSSDSRDLALSLLKLGDGQFLAAHTKDALASYEQARAIAQPLYQPHSKDASFAKALGAVDERLCISLVTGGTIPQAIEKCQEAITILTPLAEVTPDNVEVLRWLAATQASYANALRLSGKHKEAIQQAQVGLQTMNKLQALAPNNAEFRRMASSTEFILSGSLAATGDTAGSLDALDRSIRSTEIAMEIDPTDLGSALRLARTLLNLSQRLANGPEKERAHDAARDALRLLGQSVDRPGSGPLEWNEYADALLKVDWPDLRSPHRAMQLAEKAVASTNRKNPFFLDTLAWAYYRAGESNKAAETEREALGLLPANSKGGLHDELARGLTTFLAGPTK